MPTNENKTIIEWPVPEYRQHSRSRRWYIIALSAFALLMLYSLFTANFLFALLLIIAGIIIVLQDKRQAPSIAFAILDNGIALGRDFYDYGKLKSFWIFYEPDEAKTLFFEFKNKFRPRLSVPLFDKNPLHVRAELLKFLTEDVSRENEPVSEQLSRLLKL